MNGKPPQTTTLTKPLDGTTTEQDAEMVKAGFGMPVRIKSVLNHEALLLLFHTLTEYNILRYCILIGVIVMKH